ncbi:hypothetical protein C7K08_10195 [Synechococcus lacustris str. Tous]|uniref:Uncharacterized protein n=1 Tax=Synechococcus lacustris str. Tous TaxID=1910958 RepID=A0A2P7ECP2_9SYNE|nr:hypothetical protein C7K08_10195 [Synechococcus lacustris str. Tous]
MVLLMQRQGRAGGVAPGKAKSDQGDKAIAWFTCKSLSPFLLRQYLVYSKWCTELRSDSMMVAGRRGGEERQHSQVKREVTKAI